MLQITEINDFYHTDLFGLIITHRAQDAYGQESSPSTFDKNLSYFDPSSQPDLWEQIELNTKSIKI